jgi:hypothetical protein
MSPQIRLIVSDRGTQRIAHHGDLPGPGPPSQDRVDATGIGGGAGQRLGHEDGPIDPQRRAGVGTLAFYSLARLLPPSSDYRTKGTLTVPVLRGSPWRREYRITCYERCPAEQKREAMDLGLLRRERDHRASSPLGTRTGGSAKGAQRNGCVVHADADVKSSVLPMPRAPARLGRIRSTDIAPQQVLQPCCQSVHSAGPKTQGFN